MILTISMTISIVTLLIISSISVGYTLVTLENKNMLNSPKRQVIAGALLMLFALSFGVVVTFAIVGAMSL